MKWYVYIYRISSISKFVGTRNLSYVLHRSRRKKPGDVHTFVNTSLLQQRVSKLVFSDGSQQITREIWQREETGEEET